MAVARAMPAYDLMNMFLLVILRRLASMPANGAAIMA